MGGDVAELNQCKACKVWFPDEHEMILMPEMQLKTASEVLVMKPVFLIFCVHTREKSLLGYYHQATSLLSTCLSYFLKIPDYIAGLEPFFISKAPRPSEDDLKWELIQC